MKILAIDPGKKNAGIAVFENNKLIWIDTIDDQDSLFAYEFIKTHNPNVIVIEDQWLTRGSKVSFQDVKWLIISRAVWSTCADLQGIPVHFVVPANWSRYFNLNTLYGETSHVRKKRIEHFACEKANVLLDPDACDAYLIGSYWIAKNGGNNGT